MLKLKSFTLQSGVIQSPMAGCTDLAFRLHARSYGMEFAFLEMVSADALVRGNKKTNGLLKSVEADRPLGAQLVGCNPDTMGEAAEQIEGMGFDWLDLNLGCPVPKIVSPGGGSALLADPEKAGKIFRSVAAKIKKIPLTVKMRKGFSDPSGDEAVRIARMAEDAGFDAVAIHGRTRSQGYSGTADWEAIGKVKRALSIPVIGNGDVNNSADAKRLTEVSGCDAVMIGRGALGNPWIYASIANTLAGKANASAVKEPSLAERKLAALKHLELEVATEGERLGVLKSRRIICWYFKNCPNVTQFRDGINRAASSEEMRALIESFFGS